MYFQNFFSSLNVRVIDRNLTVKSSRSQKCGVKDIRPVRCGDNNNAVVHAEAVHFNKKLVERLFPFIVSAAHSGTSVTADGINFINEKN